VIICLTETRWKTCEKTDCNRSRTRTEFTLDIDWDCSGKLTTVTTVTDKYGNRNQNENSSNCHGSQCQMPDCTKLKQTTCWSTQAKSLYIPKSSSEVYLVETIKFFCPFEIYI
jgi:hypothetical protein